MHLFQPSLDHPKKATNIHASLTFDESHGRAPSKHSASIGAQLTVEVYSEGQMGTSSNLSLEQGIQGVPDFRRLQCKDEGGENAFMIELTFCAELTEQNDPEPMMKSNYGPLTESRRAPQGQPRSLDSPNLKQAKNENHLPM
jgi:hypothetical protein